MELKSIKFLNQAYQVAIRDNVDESVMAEIFKWREYRCVDEIVKRAKIIVDVGAHIGLFSLYCRVLNQKTKIFALEPEPENYKILKQNIKQNKIAGVVLSQMALAGKSGSRELIIAEDNHNHYLSPLDKESTDEEVILIKAASLNDYCRLNKIEKIDLLKMDIEGGEYEVVAAWNPDDFSLVSSLVLEYHSQETNQYKTIEKTLRENGFSVEIFPSRFDKTMGFLLARNKRNRP